MWWWLAAVILTQAATANECDDAAPFEARKRRDVRWSGASLSAFVIGNTKPKFSISPSSSSADAHAQLLERAYEAQQLFLAKWPRRRSFCIRSSAGMYVFGCCFRR